jgi:uncharacterized Fe-S center protein
MKAKVWFTRTQDGATQESLAPIVVRVAEKAGLKQVARRQGLVGILQHMGEGQGNGYLQPVITRALAERLRHWKAKPFLTGSSTLYKGRRSNACDHLMQAYEHGFTPEQIACPIVMSDGLRGADRIAVRVPRARHCRVAYLGSAVGMMDGLVVVSHPTGHLAAGFGASLKNVAMGLADRGGKMAMHHGGHPLFKAAKCTACGRCAEWCPADAIAIRKTARLNVKKCIGCGECYAMCPADAIAFEWTHSGAVFQQRLVDYCAAFQRKLGDRALYLNVCRHFTKDCDCFDIVQRKLCPDIGILASRDIVAVDKATVDLLNQTAGRDLVQDVWKRKYLDMFEYAERIGLGTCDYALIES